MTMDIEKTNTITLSILEEATSYHRWIFEKIKPYLKGNILEVGCGTGNLTGWLLGWGKVVASDMNEDYLQLDKDLGHFRRYSKKELVSKVEQSGFRILYLTYFNPFGILGWFFNGSILRRRILPQNQVKVFNKMVPLFISLEKIIPNWVGQSLIVVGEKR